MTANIETFALGLAEELDYSVDGDTGMLNIADATQIIVAALLPRETKVKELIALTEKLIMTREEDWGACEPNCSCTNAQTRNALMALKADLT